MLHLSLVERANMIKERFGFAKLDPSTLFHLYKRNKINWLAPSY